MHKCTRCGNMFDLKKSLRCPRCLEPALAACKCSGACGKCGHKDCV